MQRPSRQSKRGAQVGTLVVIDWEDAETLNGWHSAAEIKEWKMPLVRSVGVAIEVTDEMVVLAGDYSAPGDELNRLTRIPTQ